MNFKEIPELRIGQAIYNFLNWLRVKKDFSGENAYSHMADPFYISDVNLERYYKEYLVEMELFRVPYSSQ